MANDSSEYRIPDFILSAALGDAAEAAKTPANLTAKNGGGDFSARGSSPHLTTLAEQTKRNSTSEDWSIYQELTATMEEIERCRAAVM